MATDRPYGVPPPTYRLPDSTRLGQTRLQISHLDRSLPYYRHVLGLSPLKSDTTAVSLASHEAGSPLIELRERPGIRPVPQGGLLGLFHFAILLPNRAALGRFAKHLAAEHVQFASADHLVSESIYLRDPDGLGIEVYADKPQHEWRTNGRELMMTTDALDLRSLFNAAGHEQWTDMPAGTTMGHIHLSVGDIAQARDFYHAALGLDAVVWSYPGALFLSAGGYHHHLGVNTWSAGARAATADDARLVEWELVLPERADVEAAAARVRQAGYDVSADAEDQVLTDPWGITLRLREPSLGSSTTGDGK